MSITIFCHRYCLAIQIQINVPLDFMGLLTEYKNMEIENNPIQFNNLQLEQLLKSAQPLEKDLAEKLIKMNVAQQIDQSQLSFIGSVIDFYI